MSLSTRSVVTAAIATVFAAAAYWGELPLLVVSAILALVVGFGWPNLLDIPMASGSRLVVAFAGAGAVITTGVTTVEPILGYLPLVVAMSVVLAFVAELLRTDGRERLVESLIGTVSGIVVAISCAGWIAIGRVPDGTALVVAAAAGMAIASAMCAVRMPEWVAATSAVILATGAGVGIGVLLPEVEWFTGLAAGLVSGLSVAGLFLLFDRLPAMRGRLGGMSAAGLPVALGGTLIFVVGRIAMG